MRIMVTGGAGYIGSHTAKSLAAAGMQPITLDDLTTGHSSTVRWGPLIRCDIGDSYAVRCAIEDYSIEAVLHFAGLCYVGDSVRDPRAYFRNNVTNTIKLLDTICDAGVRYFVFSSSCATYGIPKIVPITEDTLQCPISPYGESKLFVERILHWYGRAYGLKWLALRYFNAAGADPDGELGESHDPETHLIPLAIQAALGRRAELEIYGSDYPTPDGSAIRDYIHVTDLANAHVRALQYLQGGGVSRALNIGTGKGLSVYEILETVQNITGLRVPVRVAPRREGDAPVLVAEVKHAREVLGWTPRFSSIESIIATAYSWQSRAPAAACNDVARNGPLPREAGRALA